jgi:tetratricopeptide (TPR) repeat protein
MLCVRSEAWGCIGALFLILLCAAGATPQTASGHVAKASERIRAGDLAAAESELNAAVQPGTSGNSDPQAYSLLGLICSRTNRLEQAIFYYQRALVLAPNSESARNGLGSAYIQHGDLDRAFTLFNTSLKTRPDDVTAHFNIGVILAQQGRYVDAIKSLESARKLDPRDPVISIWLARLQVKADMLPESVVSLETALASMAQNSRGRANAGLIAEVLEVSSRLRALSPDAKTAFLLAQAQFLAGDYDGAIGNLGQVPDTDRRAEYYNLLGMAYVGRKQFPEAIAALSKGIQIEPARTDLLFSLGSIYQGSGDNETAIRVFKRALAAGDDSAELQFGLALSFFNLGSYEAAVKSCSRAIGISPDFDQAYLLSGRSYARMAQPSRAIAAMRKAVTINPGCEQCYFQLALLLGDSGGESEAMQLLREAIRLNPRDASAHYELGKIMAQQKRNSEAIAELRKTIEYDREHDRAYYQLGRLYLALGDRAEAQTFFETARDLKEKRRAASQERLSNSK